jgi:glutaredoxin 2
MDGIKNNVIFMSALEIEATHYFLNKFTGKGDSLAKDFIKIFKSFEQSLNNIGQDNKELDDLRKDLSAAQQGIEAV